MSQPFKLDRQQLSKFLPNHEAIKAFELLFRYVVDIAPEILDDLTAYSAGFRNSSNQLNDIALRLESIEQDQRKINSANNDIALRLEALEQIVSLRSNDVKTVERIEKLEQILGV